MAHSLSTTKTAPYCTHEHIVQQLKRDNASVCVRIYFAPSGRERLTAFSLILRVRMRGLEFQSERVEVYCLPYYRKEQQYQDSRQDHTGEEQQLNQ